MPSIKSVQRRIRSTKNTAQITKAMEMVSATKMRHSQEFALRARPYALAALNMLGNLLAKTSEVSDLLQVRKKIEKKALLVITSDKGLAGALNANVLRRAEAWVKTAREKEMSYGVITVGKKAREYFERRGVVVFKHFSGVGDVVSLEETSPIAEMIMRGFLDGAWDELDAVYTHFRTTLLQEAIVRRVLPVTKEGIREIVNGILPEHGKYAELQDGKVSYVYEYKFEPSPAEILEALIPRLLKMHIHHMILEANASEHSARMVAMKNASENAKELITDLTLMYNKARQAGITRELAEITAGKEVLEQ